MPRSLSSAWHSLGAFSRRDPTLFVASFAVYMALAGCSLLAPGSAFNTVSTYSAARELGFNENFVGASMLLDACLVMWCLGDRIASARAWIAYMSGALWTFWAALALLSGLRSGFISSTAVWTIFASISLINAAWPLSGSGQPVKPQGPLPLSPRPWDEPGPTLRSAPE